MKKEYAEKVASRIIEQLRQGIAPWQKPWQPGEMQLPHNPTTDRPYRGVDSVWLHAQGFSDPRWMTYKQAQDAGAQVRRGSKGTEITYWKFGETRTEKDENGKPVLDEDGQPKKIEVRFERPQAFSAYVFNAEQIDGLPPLEPKEVAPEPERHARAEAILTNSGADIRHVPGNRAYYQVSTDRITLPERHQFDTASGFYTTALHELGHWSGHPSRLDRDLAHPFGSEEYAKEELRAEIASMMVGERLELGHDPGDHAAYVKSWIKALQEDPQEIFRAAAAAEKIAGFVVGFEQEQVRDVQVEAKQTPEQPGQEQAMSDPEQSFKQYEEAQRAYVEPLRTGYKELLERPGVATTGITLIDDKPVTEIRFKSTEKDGEQSYDLSLKQFDEETQLQVDADWLACTVGSENAAAIHEAGKGTLKGSKLANEYGLSSAEVKRRYEEAILTGKIQGRATEQSPATSEPQEETTATGKVYLEVPYKEKDQAYALGARWDGKAKKWYAPEGVNPAQSGLDRWRADGPNVVQPKSAEEQFADALREAGLQLDGLPVMDGKIHRVPVKSDKGSETSGAYAGHLTGRTPGGYIQNYKTGEKTNWKPEGKVAAISEEERARLNAEATQHRAQREAETAAKQEATAEAAQALWGEAPDATADNPYCRAKGITDPMGLRVVPDRVSSETEAKGIKIAQTVGEAQALRQADPNNRVFKAGDLLVPARDGDGKLWSLQAVNPHFKSFMKEGRKQGLYTTAIGRGDTGNIANLMILAEGYATADSVAQAIGQPVVVAFDSGNLGAVARNIRAKFPDHTLIIAADNDHTKPLEGKPNVGLETAQKVAKEYGAGVMAPQFAPGEKGSDWNDFATNRGSEAMRQHLTKQMTTAKAEAAKLMTKTEDQVGQRQAGNGRKAPSINDRLAGKPPEPGAPGSKPPRSPSPKPKPRSRGADLGL